MTKRKWASVLPIIGLCTLILGVLLGLEHFKPEPEQKPFQAKKLKVFVQPSVSQVTQLYAFSQGEVVPKQQVELKSQVEGRVTFVAANMVNGGRIDKGQLLLKLDDTDYKLQLIQREANVAQSKQQLARVKAQARVAKQELKTLRRDNANELALWVPQLAHAQAELSAAQAQLQQAQLALSRTEIRAPFTGVVKRESVNLGQQVGRNSVIATLYASNVMEVSLALNDEQLATLDLPIDFYQEEYEKGRALELYTEIGQQRLSWPARLMRTAGQFDTRTRTLHVIAEVRQDDNLPLLLPGLFVNAKIRGKTVAKSTRLARTSLRPNNKVWFVDKAGLLQVKQVIPVHRNNEYVVVTGLENATQIVTSALVAPTPGVPVKALKPQRNPKRKEEKVASIKLKEHP